MKNKKILNGYETILLDDKVLFISISLGQIIKNVAKDI